MYIYIISFQYHNNNVIYRHFLFHFIIIITELNHGLEKTNYDREKKR